MERILRQVVTDEMRLGDYLSKILHLTRKEISQVKCREQGIRVNGVQERVTYRLLAGDILEIKLEEKEVSSNQLLPGSDELDILWEDKDILVVNKPAGLVVHPAHGHFQDTLANQVLAHAQKQGENLRVRAVGRLDKDTSGIVIFAKNQLTAARLGRQREQGVLQKSYLAIVSGKVEQDSGMISLPIRNQPGHLMKMETVSEAGKTAVTQYQVLTRTDGCTWLKVHIQTGRTHQIRVHFSSIGHPLLGDLLYGGSTALLSRTALHAWQIDFLHPVEGTRIHLEAPIPEDFPKTD